MIINLHIQTRTLVARVILVWSILPLAAVARQERDCVAPPLICRASYNQAISASLRDRSRYEQGVSIERYKPSKAGRFEGKLEAVRDTVAIVQPSLDPDETGRYPVITRIISDTDDKGRPKSKVDPNARTALGSGVFLDIAFFPLLPEKLRFYQFQEIVSQKPDEKIYRFVPLPDERAEPLATGTVQVDPKTGEVLTIRIEGLSNLESLDKAFKGLQSFSAIIDYSQFDGKYRMPALASGSGQSDISHFKGEFRFKYHESKYVRILEVVH